LEEQHFLQSLDTAAAFMVHLMAESNLVSTQVLVVEQAAEEHSTRQVLELLPP
jgi:hypothetical protein